MRHSPAIAASVALLAVVLATGAADAGQPSPFPSASPSPAVTPGANGFAAIGIDVLSATGGSAPTALSGQAPGAFPSSGAFGFSLDISGRLSSKTTAFFHFSDEAVHGGDRPLQTRSEGGLLYGPEQHVAFGPSFVAFARSTSTSATTAFGGGFALFPQVTRRASPYASLFVYPGAITTFQGGVALAPARRGGGFLRLGFVGQTTSGSGAGPATLLGLGFGLGTSF